MKGTDEMEGQLEMGKTLLVYFLTSRNTLEVYLPPPQGCDRRRDTC